MCIRDRLRSMQVMLNRLVAWGRTKGLEFNSTKTVVILFGKGRLQPPFRLEIDNAEIPFSDTVKYLGVVLDKKLTWAVHIDSKITKAKKLLNLVRTATLANWGP